MKHRAMAGHKANLWLPNKVSIDHMLGICRGGCHEADTCCSRRHRFAHARHRLCLVVTAKGFWTPCGYSPHVRVQILQRPSISSGIGFRCSLRVTDRKSFVGHSSVEEPQGSGPWVFLGVTSFDPPRRADHRRLARLQNNPHLSHMKGWNAGFSSVENKGWTHHWNPILGGC